MPGAEPVMFPKNTELLQTVCWWSDVYNFKLVQDCAECLLSVVYPLILLWCVRAEAHAYPCCLLRLDFRLLPQQASLPFHKLLQSITLFRCARVLTVPYPIPSC